MLCPGCGNEIESDRNCPVCEDREAREHEKSWGSKTRLCSGCGNTLYDDSPCSICKSGHAVRKRRSSFCAGCGNEVESDRECPICADRRTLGGGRRRKGGNEPLCPQCDEALQEQDWEGIPVRICESCQGTLFPAGGLEQALDKLRAGNDSEDMQAIMNEFRNRPSIALPKTVRYKACPICSDAMVRRNYKGVSGIIVEQCGDHGTWVSPAAFGELADFVSRGGDAYAERFKR